MGSCQPAPVLGYELECGEVRREMMVMMEVRIVVMVVMVMASCPPLKAGISEQFCLLFF